MHCTQNSVMVKPATFFLYDLYTCLAQCEYKRSVGRVWVGTFSNCVIVSYTCYSLLPSNVIY